MHSFASKDLQSYQLSCRMYSPPVPLKDFPMAMKMAISIWKATKLLSKLLYIGDSFSWILYAILAMAKSYVPNHNERLHSSAIFKERRNVSATTAVDVGEFLIFDKYQIFCWTWFDSAFQPPYIGTTNFNANENIQINFRICLQNFFINNYN